jgi:hypothetical protein
MNKLEQKIAEACGFKKIAGLDYSNSDINTARIAASIALEVGFKAFKAGNGFYDLTEDEYIKYFEDFKKEIL